MFVEHVTNNKDGTISIVWGYHNKTTKNITLFAHEAYIDLQEGEVITIPSRFPRNFEPGKHTGILTTIINSTTKMNIVVDNYKELVTFEKFAS